MNFRIIYILFIVLATAFLFLQGKLIDRRYVLPAFLKQDTVAEHHNAAITVMVKCGGLQPNEAQIDILAKNYDALWAHLNYLYRTNDVEKGKEYYTEEWFRLICRDNPTTFQLPVTRTDLSHQLNIIEWSADGLVCAAIDSNVHICYRYYSGQKKDSTVYTIANYAVTLLFQGDHWRIDAFHLINEWPAAIALRTEKTAFLLNKKKTGSTLKPVIIIQLYKSNIMKLAFVSPYPPSQVTLNEYGYHLIKSFPQKSEIEKIFVLTDRLKDNSQYRRYAEEGIEIIPCWKFNSLFNFIYIARTLRKLKADAVILNLQFMTFGSGKVPAALGLLTPWMCKLLKIPSIVILHNITETVKLDTIGMAGSKWKENLFRWIGTRLTKFILKADLVGVTISQYVDILRQKYQVKNVILLPHGNFELPERKLLPQPLKDINLMAFGKFGTYKKVEVLFDACELLMMQYPSLSFRITVAGTDNPNVSGYLESVKNKYSHLGNAVFTGYVAEEDVAGIFEDSTFIIFPYTTTTGSSGILHQAGSYARAAILPKIDDLERVVEEEGYAGAYFEVNNAGSMAQAISSLLDDPAQRIQIESQNYAAAKGLPMSELAHWYLCHLKAISQVSRKSVNGRDYGGQLKPAV